MTDQEIKEKVEMVKKHLADEWSIHVSFRKAGVTQRMQQYIRPHLKAEIAKYKSKYPGPSLS